MPKTPETPGAEDARRRAEDETGRDRERRDYERAATRSRGLPLGGEDIMERVEGARILEGGETRELDRAIRLVLSYQMGLDFGPEGVAYDVDRNPQALVYLQSKFTSAEAAVSSPESGYIQIAVQNAIGGRIRRAQEFDSDREGWRQTHERQIGAEVEEIARARLLQGETVTPDELQAYRAYFTAQLDREQAELTNTVEAIPHLQELHNRVRSLGILRAAFIQREQSAGDPGSFATMVERDRNYHTPVTPDAPDWSVIFSGSQGEAMDRVLRAMVQVALPQPGQLYPRRESRLGVNGRIEEVFDQNVDGIPADVYATGFPNSKVFQRYYSHLSRPEQGNGAADAIWQAWMMAEIWEIPAELGIAIGVKDGKEKFVMGTPPITNAIAGWQMHLREKQELEYGLDAKGQRLVVERFGGHSGLPIFFLGPKQEKAVRDALTSAINKPDLSDEQRRGVQQVLAGVQQGMVDALAAKSPCHSFLHETTVTISADLLNTSIGENMTLIAQLRRNIGAQNAASPNSPEKARLLELLGKARETINGGKDLKITLWDLWHYGGLSFASPDFPWYQTAALAADEPGDELEPGSYETWLLRRSRAAKVTEDLRQVYPLSELANPAFFAARIRNWTKVWGTLDATKKPGEPGYVYPHESVYAWFVAAQLAYHRGGPAGNMPVVKENVAELDVRPLLPREVPDKDKAGMSTGPSGVTYGDIFRHALMWGFLRPEDVDFIKGLLGI